MSFADSEKPGRRTSCVRHQRHLRPSRWAFNLFKTNTEPTYSWNVQRKYCFLWKSDWQKKRPRFVPPVTRSFFTPSHTGVAAPPPFSVWLGAFIFAPARTLALGARAHRLSQWRPLPSPVSPLRWEQGAERVLRGGERDVGARLLEGELRWGGGNDYH